VIVFYISGHGFGHASRCTELISKLTTRRPDLQIVVRTGAPPWFLDDIRSQHQLFHQRRRLRGRAELLWNF